MRYSLLGLLLLVTLTGSAQASMGTPADDSSTREFQAIITDIVLDEETDGIRRVVFTAEDENGRSLTVDSAESYTEGVRFNIRERQNVILQEVSIQGGEPDVFFVDIVRTTRLIWIFVIFALATLLVGLRRGAFALVGLGVTILLLFAWIFPRILAGADPLLTTVLASVVILAVNMHLTHGFRWQTVMAFASTLIGLGLVVLFAEGMSAFAHLSGLASEEEVFVLFSSNGLIDPRGLLLSGIVLGAVGVLDDIAITQGETVAELRETSPHLRRRELFSRAMRIGRHHIASVVNTLVLAYAGVALPLFLLFLLGNNLPAWRFLNEELVAEEIVRTLAGTFALVLLVPISTWLATLKPAPRHPSHH